MQGVSSRLVLPGLAVLFVVLGGCGGNDDEALARAQQVLAAAPVVDGHNDLPWVIREKFEGNVEGYDISRRAKFDTDIPRLREGRVGTQFWSVYVPSSLSPLEAMQAQLEQIDIARRMIGLYPDDLQLATSVADIEAARQSGRIASLLGMEGGHSIVNSLGALRAYYALGVRYMTLTHFHSNDWADSATDDARHEGMTDFGREVVHEMNRLGMLVDLSHVSVDTMNDVLDVAEAPVIFSHSSARELTDHVRNVPDSVLKRLGRNGGVVMVTFIPAYVSEERREWEDGMIPLLKTATTDAEWEEIGRAYRKEHGKPPIATLDDVADHIEHVAKVAGIDHVGIGSDFYGAEGDDLVEGLEDVSRFPYLIAELLQRGWSGEDIAKLTRENLLRALSEAEQVAIRLQKDGPPSLMSFEDQEKD
ncbi:MAG TPA: dipeptidase [Woeseiaceae bacterium]|nr:dipeptidase [Woeseiaceae bacterium]